MQSVCFGLIAYVPHRAEKGLERREDPTGSIRFGSVPRSAVLRLISFRELQVQLSLRLHN